MVLLLPQFSGHSEPGHACEPGGGHPDGSRWGAQGGRTVSEEYEPHLGERVRGEIGLLTGTRMSRMSGIGSFLKVEP